MGIKLVKKVKQREARELLRTGSFKYIVGWSQYDAYGEYHVDVTRKLCLYVHFNERAGTDNSTLYEFDDLNDLANWIWESQKGTIPFNRIREAIKNVFGVDVQMAPENRIVLLLFGEATEEVEESLRSSGDAF